MGGVHQQWVADLITNRIFSGVGKRVFSPNYLPLFSRSVTGLSGERFGVGTAGKSWYVSNFVTGSLSRKITIIKKAPIVDMCPSDVL